MSLVGEAGYKEMDICRIPQDWVATTLGNCATITMGQSPAGETYNSNGIGKPLLNGPTEFTSRHPVKAQWTTSPTKLCKPGDILICVRGSSTGRMNIANDEYCIGRGLASVRHKPGYSQEYLVHLLNHSISKILKSATGSTFPSIDGKAISSISVPTPPRPEQEKIAAVLTAVDDKLDVIARQIEATQSLKRGLMQTLFSRGVGTQDADGRWVSHAEFKDSELGEIPVGWECLKLGDVLAEKPEYGANASAVSFDAENRIRYLRITDIDEHGRLRSTSIKGIRFDEAKDYMLAEGDLLIARSGNTVGKSILYERAMGPCAFAGYLLRFRFNHKALVDYVAAYLTSSTYWAWVKASVKVGAQPNINAQQYQSMLIPVPPIAEQHRIATVLAEVSSKVELLRRREAQFQTLKRGLMQKLLTGEWRVKVDAEMAA